MQDEPSEEAPPSTDEVALPVVVNSVATSVVDTPAPEEPSVTATNQTDEDDKADDDQVRSPSFLPDYSAGDEPPSISDREDKTFPINDAGFHQDPAPQSKPLP